MDRLFLTALLVGLLVALAAAIRIEDISAEHAPVIEYVEEPTDSSSNYKVPSDWSLMLYSLQAQMVTKYNANKNMYEIIIFNVPGKCGCPRPVPSTLNNKY